jgi:hypothetical protein
MIDGESLIELHRPTLGVEMEEGWLLPDFDCRHDWQPGCGAPRPAECECWGPER